MNIDNLEMPRPQDMPPMERDQFGYAFALAMHAGHLNIPMKNPGQFGVDIENEDGNVSSLRFRDIPLNRVGIAVREHFGEDINGFINFMHRFFALLKVFRNGVPEEWIAPNANDPAAQDVHPAVIYSAAETPLDRSGSFNREVFLSTVEDIAKSMEVEK